MGIIDYIVIAAYAVGLLSLALWVSRQKNGTERTSKDYFLAGNTLPWWAVGASLIAASISAEQIIGMTGDGYSMGLAIASYEWMGAITLLVVAKFLLPIYWEKKIYTMPQFLEIRFDGRIRTILAVFWILVYVFVNLTGILYLGALAFREVLGIELWQGALILATFSALYTIYGGLMAIAWTDLVQVIAITIGGVLTAFLMLAAVGETTGGGVWEGLMTLSHELPEKFQLIFSRKSPFYDKLPGLAVLFGGMWIANLFYWGFNQYITQRALAAKNLNEAQKGMAFASLLKIIIPLILVIPGIAAFYLNKNIDPNTGAYAWILAHHIPVGLKGFAFVALAAAVVSSLSSISNSISTIFTMDLYKKQIGKEASEKELVSMGRIAAGLALIIAFIIAPYFDSLQAVLEYIQAFTGYVSPGVLAIFLAGMFYKKATSNAAIWAAILTIPIGYTLTAFTLNMPFLDRIGIVFLIITGIIILISHIERKGADDPKGIELRKGIFHTSNAFNIGSIAGMAILAVFYILF